MKRHSLCTRLLLLSFVLALLALCFTFGASAATPPQDPPATTASGDHTLMIVLIVLIAILLACIILLIGLTQWVRVRYLKARRQVVALEKEVDELKKKLVAASSAAPVTIPAKTKESAKIEKKTEGKAETAKEEEHPFAETAEDAPQSSVGIAPADEAVNEQTEETEEHAQNHVADQATPGKESKTIAATKAKKQESKPDTQKHTGEQRFATMASALSSLQGDTQSDEMSTTLITPDGRHILIKYRQSFRARMVQADDESKKAYSDMKNYLLSFNGVSATDSQNYESFAAARRPLAKINITGKTLVVYLALDPAKLEGSKYKFDSVGDRKRFEKTPVKIKVRSARSFKWAQELVDMTMADSGIEKGELQNADYIPATESKESLIARGLIQVSAQEVESGAKVDEETIVRLIEAGATIEGSFKMPLAPTGEGLVAIPEEYAAEYIPHSDAVSVEEAIGMMENEVAEHHLYHRLNSKHEGKQVIINVDTLDASFAAGDTVTLEKLKGMKLVEPSAGRLKVLARGILSKPLIVEADDFSIDALKMILITGGSPVELD